MKYLQRVDIYRFVCILRVINEIISNGINKRGKWKI